MRNVGLVIFAALALTGTAMAKSKPGDDAGNAPPEIYQKLLACRAITDTAQRLACFDRTTATLAQATEKHDVLIVDRETVRATKRGLFGLQLPNLKLFGGNDTEVVNHIDTTITAEYTTKQGEQVFVLADGSRWQETEGRDTFPRAGQPITIVKEPFGDFMARVNHQPGVRVMRIQ